MSISQKMILRSHDSIKKVTSFIARFLFIFLLLFSGFTGTQTLTSQQLHTVQNDNCQNAKFIVAEKIAREERDKKIKEIEELHDKNIDIIDRNQKKEIDSIDDAYQLNLHTCAGVVNCINKIESEYKKQRKSSLDGYLDAKQVNDLVRKESIEAAQDKYLEAVSKAHYLYPNAYRVEKDDYFSGTICNLRQPFVITATSAALNLKATYKFVPETDSTGTLSFNFTYKIGKSAGSGKYIIKGLNTCSPVILTGGNITTKAGTISSTGGGDYQIKLVFIKDCGQ